MNVLVVIGFTLVQLLLIEIPIVAFEIAPHPTAIEHAKGSARRHGREYGAWGLAVIGAWLAIRGIVRLLSTGERRAMTQAMTQRKPMWLVVVSTASPWRAAGR